MTDGLNAFSYNILIANLHEMQNFFYKELNKKYTKKTLTENFSKILVPKIMSFVYKLNTDRNFI